MKTILIKKFLKQFLISIQNTQQKYFIISKWSLGVTIWEMLTMGQLPYTSLPSTELLQFLKNSFRLPQPPICPDNL